MTFVALVVAMLALAGIRGWSSITNIRQNGWKQFKPPALKAWENYGRDLAWWGTGFAALTVVKTQFLWFFPYVSLMFVAGYRFTKIFRSDFCLIPDSKRHTGKLPKVDEGLLIASTGNVGTAPSHEEGWSPARQWPFKPAESN